MFNDTTTAPTTDPKNVPHPFGAEVGEWDDNRRVCRGAHRPVADSNVVAYAYASQRTDGTFTNEHLDKPVVAIDEMFEGSWYQRLDLSAEAARSLARALNDAADELDGWVAR